MENVKDFLKKFTMSVEKLSLLWEGLSKRASKPMCEIEMLSDQLIAASHTSSDVLISRQFPDLKEQLIYQMLIALETELQLLICIIQEVADNTDSLSKLALQIDRLSVCPDHVPHYLSPSTILEFISDSAHYFRALYATLKIALLTLDFRDGLSIRNLRNAFIEGDELRTHIKCCRQIGKNIVYSIDNEVEQPENS